MAADQPIDVLLTWGAGRKPSPLPALDLAFVAVLGVGSDSLVDENLLLVG